jgi:acetyl-CoA synthetase
VSATEITPGKESDDVWHPGADELARSKILAFAKSAGCRSVEELTAKADRDPLWFWEAVTTWLDLDWQEAPDKTADQITDGHRTQWFPGGALNITENAVDRWVARGRGTEPALRWELEDGSRGSSTFAELGAQVDALCHGLAGIGVRPGDRVGLQLPTVPEAAVAMLALAKMGAICVPVFSGYGATAVTERLAFAEASVHIVADSFLRRGKSVDLRRSLAEALSGVESLVATVVVDLEPGAPARISAEPFPGEIAWADLLERHPNVPFPAARCPSDHPLLLAFTSGSTGRPKGILLSHAGFAVKAGSDAAFSFDIGRGDTAAWITDPGWIMSPIVIFGGLLVGSAVALYAGTPDWPNPRRIWDFTDAAEVTMLGLSPTLVRLLMSHDSSLPNGPGKLRVLASSGEPWTPDAYQWLYAEAFGRRLPIINYSGGTEVSGAILSNTTAQPIHPCGFAGSLPGMGADIVDQEGISQLGDVGELVLRCPSPGMPLTFWRDPERYFTTYWKQWPGLWHHGDWAEKDEDGVWYIRGRSDDTLKIAGKRVGPGEIESVVNGVPGVVESAAVGVPHPVKGDGLVVFARLRGAGAEPQVAAQRISDEVAGAMGKALRPMRVHIVSTLPRTRSGKILRRVIRAAYLGEPLGDLSALDDVESVRTIVNLR